MNTLNLTPVWEEEWDGRVNWYHHPEKYGLETIRSINLAGSYEFSIYVVLKDTEDHYWWAHDSGCSCPIPFDDTWLLNSLDDYHDWIDFKDKVLDTSVNRGDDSINAAEFILALEKVVPGAAWERLRKMGQA